ncbi:MAG: hypothetical protein RLZZ358_551, partial [Bacteroidota bacterium]
SNKNDGNEDRNWCQQVVQIQAVIAHVRKDIPSGHLIPDVGVVFLRKIQDQNHQNQEDDYKKVGLQKFFDDELV